MNCVHRWRIDSPNGSTSTGTCWRCGADRDDFKNGAELSASQLLMLATGNGEAMAAYAKRIASDE